MQSLNKNEGVLVNTTGVDTLEARKTDYPSTNLGPSQQLTLVSDNGISVEITEQQSLPVNPQQTFGKLCMESVTLGSLEPASKEGVIGWNTVNVAYLPQHDAVPILAPSPNGKDCIRMESDDPIPLAWSQSEHQKKPTGLLTPGVESKTKENQAMSQQHPNSEAASVDSYPEGIGFLSTDGHDSPLEDQEPLTQIMDDVLMCGSAQQENIKMERHPVSYADIMKHGILNAADATSSYEPLMPARPITEEDCLDAQGRPYDHDETVGPPAIGKAPRIGSPSHVALDHHQGGGELSLGTKFGQLRRNILELHKQFTAPRAHEKEDSCNDRDIHYDGLRLKSILKNPKKPKKKRSPSVL